MKYNDLIIEARRSGVWTEDTMVKSVNSFDGILQYVKDTNKDVYWAFMRQQCGILYGQHYNETFAAYDVGQMCSTDSDGNVRRGAYWTVAQIEDATRGFDFPNGVTQWDKYVAFNAMWHDMRGRLDDSQVLTAAYNFYFADEDCDDTGTKIWRYMACMNKPKTA